MRMTMSVLVGVVAWAVLVGNAAADGFAYERSPHQNALPKTYVLPGDTLFPEGMGYDPSNGDFFVGSFAGGAVIRGNVNNPAAQVFSAAGSDGRSAALGARPDHGRVLVGSIGSGKVWIYDEKSGRLIATLDTGMPTSVLNDFSFLRDGTAFVTDSVNPILWRITFGRHGTPTLEKWLDFTGTPFAYTAAFNADGIVTSPDGRYLVINNVSTGQLARVEVATKTVSLIDVGGFDLTNADGMDLTGGSLYVVRNANAQIVKVDLSPDFSTGAVDTITTSPAFLFPTAAVIVGSADDQGDQDGEHHGPGGTRLLVLNSQLDKLGGTPSLPFSITNITLP
jgi:sugar lactone lactonase YvrE